MGDFTIKKIILPSGKSVEIVYFNAHEPEDLAPIRLEVCPECDGEQVYPISWRETDNDAWDIELRCPNCEWRERALFDDDVVQEFDATLNAQTDQLIDGLEQLTRANMEDQIERFSRALEYDAILPEDF
jgi:hypothetical protein